MTLIKRISTILGAAVLALSAIAHAGPGTETDGNDVILAGHDAVAYFIQGKPVVGSADYTAAHNGLSTVLVPLKTAIALTKTLSAMRRNTVASVPTA